VLQAPLFHGFPFGFRSFEQDGLSAAGVDISGREVFEALVIALMVGGLAPAEGVRLERIVASSVIGLPLRKLRNGYSVWNCGPSFISSAMLR